MGGKNSQLTTPWQWEVFTNTPGIQCNCEGLVALASGRGQRGGGRGKARQGASFVIALVTVPEISQARMWGCKIERRQILTPGWSVPESWGQCALSWMTTKTCGGLQEDGSEALPLLGLPSPLTNVQFLP